MAAWHHHWMSVGTRTIVHLEDNLRSRRQARLAELDALAG